MSDTPTEPASERTLERARARGDVPFTRDWPFAAALLGLSTGAAYLGPELVRIWSHAATRALSADQVALYADGRELVRLVAKLLLLPCVAALLLVVAQRAPVWRLWRTDLTSGAAPELPKVIGYVRWLVLTACVLVVLRGSGQGLSSAWQADAPALLAITLRVLRALLLRAALTLVVLGVLDVWLQQIWRRRRLRMTHRQVRDERRELQGDPRWSSEQRKRAQVGAQPGLPLRAATLVLTGQNAAVALRYLPGQDAAPVLWASARGSAALDLLAQAYAHRLPLVTDDTLTAELSSLETAQAIPSALFARVAAHMAQQPRVSGPTLPTSEVA